MIPDQRAARSKDVAAALRRLHSRNAAKWHGGQKPLARATKKLAKQPTGAEAAAVMKEFFAALAKGKKAKRLTEGRGRTQKEN